MQAMTDDEWTAYLESAARLLDLPAEAPWRGAIVANLKAIAAAAQLVAAYPLADDAEAAPVYTP